MLLALNSTPYLDGHDNEKKSERLGKNTVDDRL